MGVQKPCYARQKVFHSMHDLLDRIQLWNLYLILQKYILKGDVAESNERRPTMWVHRDQNLASTSEFHSDTSTLTKML